MNFDEYQKQAAELSIYPEGMIGIACVALGLNGEGGEVADKLKKVFRDNNGVLTEEKKQDILLEIGDTLWYVAVLCEKLETSLSDVAQMNLDKLNSRKKRDVISGSGDDR